MVCENQLKRAIGLIYTTCIKVKMLGLNRMGEEIWGVVGRGDWATNERNTIKHSDM